MTKRKESTGNAKEISKPSANSTSQVPCSETECQDKNDQGAPIEHYRGERSTGKQTGGPGSLEEETLDREAPYNGTYGQ